MVYYALSWMNGIVCAIFIQTTNNNKKGSARCGESTIAANVEERVTNGCPARPVMGWDGASNSMTKVVGCVGIVPTAMASGVVM